MSVRGSRRLLHTATPAASSTATAAAVPRQGLRGRPDRVQVTGVRGNRSGVVLLLLLFISCFREHDSITVHGRPQEAWSVSNSKYEDEPIGVGVGIGIGIDKTKHFRPRYQYRPRPSRNQELRKSLNPRTLAPESSVRGNKVAPPPLHRNPRQSAA
jgi:hypothetical protein